MPVLVQSVARSRSNTALPCRPCAGIQSTACLFHIQLLPFCCCRRIQACPGSVNPNCVSTSSTNDMYAPAWRASASTPRAALQDLDAAILGRRDAGGDAVKVLEAETPYGWYVAYSVPGRFSKPDVLEFLVRGEGVEDRGWEGDRAGPVVFYRSIAGVLVCRDCVASGTWLHLQHHIFKSEPAMRSRAARLTEAA